MTKDILLKFERFDINLDAFHYLHTLNLHELYLPVIGFEAIMLYEHFYNLKQIKNLSNIDKNIIVEVINKLSLSTEKMSDLLSTLEAIGLISSYIIGDELDSRLVFVLHKPLDYDQFINNLDFKSMLENKIGATKIHQLKYVFNNFIVGNNAKNISQPLKWLLSNKNVTEIIDFTDLSNKILLLMQKKVIFSEQDKNNIRKYYENNLIALNDLASLLCLYLKRHDDYFLVDWSKFYQDNQLGVHSNMNNVKIHRNYKIFEFNTNINEFHDVVSDYINYNSENYITNITKQAISFNLQRTIKILSNQLHLENSWINIIIDYSLHKNFGRLESNYILAIAKTINNLNLTSFEQVINYFKCIANNVKPTYELLGLNNEISKSIIDTDDIWS